MKICQIILYLLLTNLLVSQELKFTDSSYKLDGNHLHYFDTIPDPMPYRISGGIATADINNDGWQDIFMLLGDNAFGRLLLNDGKGQFKDITNLSRLDSITIKGSGPLFFNYNQDEFIDLIVGSVDGHPPIIFKNEGNLIFTPVSSPEFDILSYRNTTTITAIDFNKDGYEDLFFSHWNETFEEDHFWKNLGNNSFESVDKSLHFYNPFDNGLDYMHNANFMDINGDDYPDLLLCSDFGTSQIWINDKGQQFIYDTKNVLSDENGMGSGIEDFDNDGDFDWFVSSIFDNDGVLEGDWGGTGNKLYINQGNAIFSEQAATFGVEDAAWGWGTSFADFNNDGFLDIVVVNGWPQGSDQFKNDRLKVFISHEGVYFTEESTNIELIDSLQGRGVSCLDYDKDGDVDVLVSNYRGAAKLWENHLLNRNYFLNIKLIESTANYFGFGTKIQLYTADKIQTKQLRCGSNYLSQNPATFHFGLGDAKKIDSLIIHWTDGTFQKVYNLAVNQHLTINKLTDNPIKYFQHKAYPNPIKTHLNLAFQYTSSKDLVCEIRDTQGQLLLTSNTFTQTKDWIYFNRINVTDLSSGIYMATLISKTKHIHSIKIIKF